MKNVSRRRKTPRRRVQPPRASVSVCVLARDEERFMADCIDSALPFVDEVLVLDTGSTDRTVEIARQHGARVEFFEWCDDFSAARNAAIDLATGDWILMMDADERLQPGSGPALRAFIATDRRDAPFFAPRIENRVNPNDANDIRLSYAHRLFRHCLELRFVSSIHESLTYLPDPVRSFGLRLEDIRITHLGYMPELVKSRNKHARNVKLLLRETVARPDHPEPWYYLGMDSVAAEKPAEAAEYFRQSLARSHNAARWAIPETYTQLIWAYIQLDDVDRLRAAVEEAEARGVLSASARGQWADVLYTSGMPGEAERQLVAALEPNQPLSQIRHPGIGGWATRAKLARLYQLTGHLEPALEQIELALGDPELRSPLDLAASAVMLATEAGNAAALARWLHVAAAPDEFDLEGHIQHLELRSIAGPPPQPADALGLSPVERAIAIGDWQAAYDAALLLAMATTPETAQVLFVAARLEASGAPEAALQLLDRLVDAQPRVPQVYWLLCKVLTTMARFDDAIAANEILQSLLVEQPQLAA